jgi:hypothetical protein
MGGLENARDLANLERKLRENYEPPIADAIVRQCSARAAKAVRAARLTSRATSQNAVGTRLQERQQVVGRTAVVRGPRELRALARDDLDAGARVSRFVYRTRSGRSPGWLGLLPRKSPAALPVAEQSGRARFRRQAAARLRRRASLPSCPDSRRR